ncbi:MAG: serine--tRNA ligase [Patescibacteria group bacterium]
MLDINFIREHPEEVKNNILQRGVDPKKADVDRLLVLDKQRRQLTTNIEQLRHARTEAAEKRDIERGRKLKEDLKSLEEQLEPLVTEWQLLMSWMPNMLSADTPVGKDAGGNVEIKAWHPQRGYFPKEELGLAEHSGRFMPGPAFPLRDHVELGKLLDSIDLEQSAKTSGSRFSYIKGGLSLLQFALFELLKNKLLQEGFTPMIVPLLVKEKVLYGTSHFPGDADQVYKIENKYVEENQDLFLVGSSEPSLFGYYLDKVLASDELPQKFFAYTSCFRSEVGSWGKDVRGLKRVHQFDKLEMDALTAPEASGEMHEYLLSLNEWFLQQLRLPYHVILMCSGDTGYAATHKKYDIEVWLPSQKTYMEVMSDTNATDFQSRRFNTRYLNSKGEKEYVHNVNDTGCAMGRMIIAILDNYQQPDGSVKVPGALQAYVGKELLEPKK